MEKTVLVCDDDHEIVDALRIYLEKEGYRVLEAYDGREALMQLEKEDVHLVLLDVMMPGMSGLEALHWIREKKSLPIIIISAKGENQDKIEGLTLGADDYVTKPFDMMEVMARVNSQIRRYLQYRKLPDDDTLLRVGGLVANLSTRQVWMDGEELSLTPLEYQVLTFFMKEPGKTFSSKEIYEAVWKEDSVGSAQTVAVHIRHIREKIEITPEEPRYLQVVWGLGYKLEGKRESDEN